MTRMGEPVAAPLDRCLAQSAMLPLPEGTTARDRDILFAVIGRRLTRRSMRELDAEFGLREGHARALALKIMRRQGISGLHWNEPGYGKTSDEVWRIRIALARGLERLPLDLCDNR